MSPANTNWSPDGGQEINTDSGSNHFALEQGVLQHIFLSGVIKCRFDEMDENRLWILHRTFQLRMVLHPDKERMMGQFHDFDQPAFRVFAAGQP